MKQSTRAVLALLTAVLGAIALTGLRYYQLWHCMDERGLLIPGSRVAWGFVALIVAMIAALVLLLVGLERTAGSEKAFSCGIFPKLCSAVAAAGFMAGCAICSIGTELGDTAHLIIFSVGVACAALLVISDALRIMGKRTSFLLLLIPSLFLAAKLVIDFKHWSVDPNVIDFCFKLLASVTAMLACFNLAGFPISLGKRRTTVFLCLLAFAFCTMTAADFILKRSCELGEFLIFIFLGLWCFANGLILLFGKDAAPSAPVEDAPAEEPAEDAEIRL